MRLSISRQAQTDLDGIWIYIAQESGSAEIADRVLDSVGKTLRVIRLFPTRERAARRICAQASVVSPQGIT